MTHSCSKAVAIVGRVFQVGEIKGLKAGGRRRQPKYSPF